MAGMKKCKECGKLFLPKGRESYCSEDHYRPCPVCGKPVIVTYFSDPPRKCDECKHKRGRSSPVKEPTTHSKSLFNFTPQDGSTAVTVDSSNAQQAVGPSENWIDRVDVRIPDTVDRKEFCNLITGDTFIYVGPEIKNGFTKGHEYMLKLEIHDQVYWATGTEDRTLDKDVTIVIPYTSQRSFYQNFARVKE